MGMSLWRQMLMGVHILAGLLAIGCGVCFVLIRARGDWSRGRKWPGGVESVMRGHWIPRALPVIIRTLRVSSSAYVQYIGKLKSTIRGKCYPILFHWIITWDFPNPPVLPFLINSDPQMVPLLVSVFQQLEKWKPLALFLQLNGGL